MREIVLDTETTGLSPLDGHRIIEIGALELINHIPTGETYHIYINPERPIDPGAAAVHGITDERVAGEPVFAEIMDDFLSFIGSSPLVIHNAPFDMGFINAELERCEKPLLPSERAIDTLVMARKKFPGGQASLDALCRKFRIDNSHRDLHGALVDADLLAEVYIELLGGKQQDLTLAASDTPSVEVDAVSDIKPKQATLRPARPHSANSEELSAHDEFVDQMKKPLWRHFDTKSGSNTE